MLLLGSQFASQGHLKQQWLQRQVSENVTNGARDALRSYLPHGVVLYRNFSEEEVDIVSIIQCLDKVGLCGQTGTLIGDMSHSVKRILIKCSQRRVIN